MWNNLSLVKPEGYAVIIVAIYNQNGDKQVAVVNGVLLREVTFPNPEDVYWMYLQDIRLPR